MTKANKYVLMIGVSAKCTMLAPSLRSVVSMTGMLERAVRAWGTTRVTSKVAFKAGSSQQGSASLAPVGSN